MLRMRVQSVGPGLVVELVEEAVAWVLGLLESVR